jgi:glyoxylase-like metal-dependent hydrolase (beta-lactamase superfamily II)
LRSERKPFRVCERVYQVGGPDISHGQDCCVYLIDGDGPLALVDSGCGPGYKAVVANIIRLGFEPENLETILLTHCHIDHVGAADLFKAEYDVELVAHEKDCPPCESGNRLLTAAFLYGFKFEPLVIDRKLELDEESIAVGDQILSVVSAPGHTPGSVAAYMDITGMRVLFGQDIHGPFHPDFGSDIKVWRHSMGKLLALEADILCEGHFGIYSPSSAVRSYIRSYLDHFAR